VATRCSTLLATGRFDDVRAEIESCGWDEAAHVVVGLGRDRSLWQRADEWLEQRPTDAVAATLAGSATIARAWDVRGPGADVPQERYDQFVRLLLEAERHLEHAWRTDRAMPLSWCMMLRSGIALYVPPEELRLRYDQAVRSMGTSLVLHMYLVTGLSPRWRGSDDELTAFSHDVTSNAPGGSPLHAVTVMALVERCIANDHFDLQESRIDIREAGNLSVQHPAFAQHASHPDGRLARNWFMLAYDLAGDTALATGQRDQIGSSPTREPWSYVGEAATAFDKATHRRP
jgi:hypothetical protein